MSLESCFWGDVHAFWVYLRIKGQVVLLNFFNIVSLFANKQFSRRLEHSLGGFRNCLFLLLKKEFEGALATQLKIAHTHHAALS